MSLSNRYCFFVRHMAVSACIALLVLALVYGLWYPPPLAQAVGVTYIFLMLLAIDVVLGPVLGFLVYKEAKKSLKFDLTVIILIQITALLFGIYSIAQARPAWLVFNTDRFELVRNNDILEPETSVKHEYTQVAWTGAQWVAVEVAQNIQQKNEDLFAEALGGISIAQRPERYLELSQVKDQIQQRALQLKELEAYNSKIEVEKTLAKYPKADAWLPLKANAVDMVVLINIKTAKVIKIVNLRPWS